MNAPWTRKSDRKRCSVTFEDVGPLFAHAKCTRPGQWEIAGQAQCGRFCLAHMLERIDENRRHQMSCDGFAHGRPSLCGGITFCLGLECKPECQFRHCRAKGEPLWLHVRMALPTNVEPGPVRMAAWARRRRRRELVAKRMAVRA